MYIYVCVCMCVCVSVCMHVCMYLSVYLSIYLSIYLSMHACMHECMNECMYTACIMDICVCVDIHSEHQTQNLYPVECRRSIFQIMFQVLVGPYRYLRYHYRRSITVNVWQYKSLS